MGASIQRAEDSLTQQIESVRSCAEENERSNGSNLFSLASQVKSVQAQIDARDETIKRLDDELASLRQTNEQRVDTLKTHEVGSHLVFLSFLSPLQRRYSQSFLAAQVKGKDEALAALRVDLDAKQAQVTALEKEVRHRC